MSACFLSSSALLITLALAVPSYIIIHVVAAAAAVLYMLMKLPQSGSVLYSFLWWQELHGDVVILLSNRWLPLPRLSWTRKQASQLVFFMKNRKSQTQVQRMKRLKVCVYDEIMLFSAFPVDLICRSQSFESLIQSYFSGRCRKYLLAMVKVHVIVSYFCKQ